MRVSLFSVRAAFFILVCALATTVAATGRSNSSMTCGVKGGGYGWLCCYDPGFSCNEDLTQGEKADAAALMANIGDMEDCDELRAALQAVEILQEWTGHYPETGAQWGGYSDYAVPRISLHEQELGNADAWLHEGIHIWKQTTSHEFHDYYMGACGGLIIEG